MVVALGAWAVGCSEREERQVSAREDFEIPLTLVQRMMGAYDKANSNAQEVFMKNADRPFYRGVRRVRSPRRRTR